MADDTEAVERVRALMKPDNRLVERVVTRNQIWQGKIFEVQTLDVEQPDGSHGYREIVLHHGGAGVCAVRDGKICLVRQYRVAMGRMSLEIPAGKLDPGEEPAVCAARELREETGLEADSLEPLAVTAGAPGFNNEKTRIFVARGLHRGVATPDEGEFVDVVWVPLRDMLAAVRAGVIEDAKTVVSVMAACVEEGIR
jgi:ADP-ribose pyrophosphatase